METYSTAKGKNFSNTPKLGFGCQYGKFGREAGTTSVLGAIFIARYHQPIVIYTTEVIWRMLL
jgi:hypothetical protein